MKSQELESKMSEIKQFNKKESQFQEIDEMRNQLKEAENQNINSQNLGSSAVETYSYANFQEKSSSNQVGNIFAQLENNLSASKNEELVEEEKE